MALGFHFAHSGFTPDKYNDAVRQVEAAGAGAPAGRTYHVALESNGEIQVFDIWALSVSTSMSSPSMPVSP